jgi:hypothetical protein
LCINQQDNEEKSAQVQLMARIYRQADIVISWLGEGGDGIDVALGFFRLLKNGLSKGSDDIVHMLQDETETFAAGWLAVMQLFQHPYWSRVWILQEVLLAQRSVLCAGDESCEISVLQFLLVGLEMQVATSLSKAAREALFFPGAELARSLSLLYSERFGDAKMTLMDCLVLARERRATDPRDYIYGLLNLVDDHAIVPDYSASVATIYAELVEYMIGRDEALDVLSACLVREREDTGSGEVCLVWFVLQENVNRWIWLPAKQVSKVRRGISTFLGA